MKKSIEAKIIVTVEDASSDVDRYGGSIDCGEGTVKIGKKSYPWIFDEENGLELDMPASDAQYDRIEKKIVELIRAHGDKFVTPTTGEI